VEPLMPNDSSFRKFEGFLGIERLKVF